MTRSGSRRRAIYVVVDGMVVLTLSRSMADELGHVPLSAGSSPGARNPDLAPGFFLGQVRQSRDSTPRTGFVSPRVVTVGASLRSRGLAGGSGQGTSGASHSSHPPSWGVACFERVLQLGGRADVVIPRSVQTGTAMNIEFRWVAASAEPLRNLVHSSHQGARRGGLVCCIAPSEAVAPSLPPSAWTLARTALPRWMKARGAADSTDDSSGAAHFVPPSVPLPDQNASLSDLWPSLHPPLAVGPSHRAMRTDGGWLSTVPPHDVVGVGVRGSWGGQAPRDSASGSARAWYPGPLMRVVLEGAMVRFRFAFQDGAAPPPAKDSSAKESWRTSAAVATTPPRPGTTRGTGPNNTGTPTFALSLPHAGTPLTPGSSLTPSRGQSRGKPRSRN